MPNRRGNSLVVIEIECHYGNIVQWQLNGSAGRLHGNATSHRTIHLICKPVFAGDSLELQHHLQVSEDVICIVADVCESCGLCVVGENGLWRTSEQLVDLK